MIDLNLQSALEAMLFASAEPTEIAKLAEALETDELSVEENLLALQAKYEKTNAGIRLLKLDDKVQLVAAREFAPQIRALLQQKKNAPLSQAAFEVLAVVAYNQPVTKAFVEQVRGVDCSAVIGGLCAKGLIEERGRLDLPGRPLIYGTTSAFLRCFSLESLNDLPAVNKDDKYDESEANSDDEPSVDDEN